MLHFRLYSGKVNSVILFMILQIISLSVITAQNIIIKKIWDSGNHNAFTDIIRYKSFFYCIFREGISHVRCDTSGRGTVRILRSEDGDSRESVALLADRKYDLRDPKLSVTPDNRLMILVRRETGAWGKLGLSNPPFDEWQWTILAYHLGGPNFLVLNYGRLCIGTRLYEPGGTKTIIYLTDAEGRVENKFLLPSGGDTSYPGLLIFNNTIWISFYSSHEGKTSIYPAKISLRDLII